MSLEQNTLQELKSKLLLEKARIEDELNRIGKPTTKSGDFNTSFNEMGDGEDENASEVEEYTDNLALETTLEKQLKEIIEALAKIESGIYGLCENCNSEIPVERLMAYPSAQTCIKC
ncbi:MAG: TraR/DksA C4-type zinc finger protein [bacterium]